MLNKSIKILILTFTMVFLFSACNKKEEMEAVKIDDKNNDIKIEAQSDTVNIEVEKSLKEVKAEDVNLIEDEAKKIASNKLKELFDIDTLSQGAKFSSIFENYSNTNKFYRCLFENENYFVRVHVDALNSNVFYIKYVDNSKGLKACDEEKAKEIANKFVENRLKKTDYKLSNIAKELVFDSEDVEFYVFDYQKEKETVLTLKINANNSIIEEVLFY